ncbi:MAG: hypothetical protein ACE5JU_01375 [Candidatus Binatia bacterium]
MAKQILFPVKGRDRIEEVIPYIEEVAKPGMRVVFLIPYPVDGFLASLQDHWITMESRVKTAEMAEKVAKNYSWEKQRRLAEEKVVLAREALQKRGVEVTVDLYTDRLNRVVGSYTRNGETHLVMKRGGISLQILKFLQGTIGLFGLLKRPRIFPRASASSGSTSLDIRNHGENDPPFKNRHCLASNF